MKIITDYRQANDFLNKKHIRIEYRFKLTLENMGVDFDNIMYIAKKEAWTTLITPVTDAMVEATKAKGLFIAEIPFKGFGYDFNRALIEAANTTRERLGNISLSDIADIEEASKGEIRKLKTRLQKSKTPAELEARKAEFEALISAYEDKESDTERDDLVEHWANIREYLEEAQNNLEYNNLEEAITNLEDSIYSV